jgi:ABC-2 type transport system permease protein
MNRHLSSAVWAEGLKLRRSKLPLATLGAFTFAAGIGALFMYVLADPGRARGAGLLGEKAQMSQFTADWNGLVTFLGQAVAVGGLIVFSFVASWIFGREHADDALRFLLALPVPRSTIAAAKLIVTAGWCAVLTAWLLGAGLVFGMFLRLPGWNADLVSAGLGRAGIAAGLMVLVVAPVPFAACAGRGYNFPLAAPLGALVFAQVAAALGAGGLVPWSIPAVAAGLVPGTELDLAGWIIAGLTGLAGVAATVGWWRSGDAGI